MCVCGRVESWERGREERGRSCWEDERQKAESDSQCLDDGPPGERVRTQRATVTAN